MPRQTIRKALLKKLKIAERNLRPEDYVDLDSIKESRLDKLENIFKLEEKHLQGKKETVRAIKIALAVRKNMPLELGDIMMIPASTLDKGKYRYRYLLEQAIDEENRVWVTEKGGIQALRSPMKMDTKEIRDYIRKETK